MTTVPTVPRAGAQVALLLCGLLVTVPFLFSEHRAPIPSFYDEWLAAALAVAALAAFASAAGTHRTALPHASLWLGALAVWIGVQALVQPPAQIQLALGGMLYVLLAALLVVLGHGLVQELGMARVADALASLLLAGALANAALGIVQWYGIPDALRTLVARPPDSRAIGHVGQPNFYACYLALGQASLLYLYGRGHLSVLLAGAAGALLVFASAASLSRSALLFAAWLAVLMTFAARHDPAPPWRHTARGAWLLCAAAIIAMAWLPALRDALGIAPGAWPQSRLLDVEGWRNEPRPAAWRLALQLFVDAPWLGVGWGEFAGAAFRAGLPRELLAAGDVWTSPHNTVLQLLAESGLAGALLVLLPAWRWGRDAARQLRHAPSFAQCWVVAAAGTVALHALLEFPLRYAHGLALFALIAGIGAHRVWQAPARSMRAALVLGCIVLAAVLAPTMVDYPRLAGAHVVATGRTLAPPTETEQSLAVLRGVSHGVLGAQVAPLLYAALPYNRQEIDMKLDLGERVLRHWPALPLVARHAAFLALAGRRDEALRLIEHAAAASPLARRSLAAALERLMPLAPEAVLPLLARVAPL